MTRDERRGGCNKSNGIPRAERRRDLEERGEVAEVKDAVVQREELRCLLQRLRFSGTGRSFTVNPSVEKCVSDRMRRRLYQPMTTLCTQNGQVTAPGGQRKARASTAVATLASRR